LLNSNQACDVVFKKEHLQKLNPRRLKKFKQACERFRDRFFSSCCDMRCEYFHVKTSPENYTGHYTIEQYETWSTNMTNIRETLKTNTQL
jgi:hypothetical protein